MKKILMILFLLIPILKSIGQENKYRISAKKEGSFFASKVRVSERKITYEDENGQYGIIKTEDLIAIRPLINDWNYFEWTKSEFTDYVVVEVDSLSQEELFHFAINWIKENYKNPDEVIKATIDQSKIRFEGYQSNGIIFKNITLGAKYTIELSFREGRYKFNPVYLSYHWNGIDNTISLSSTKQYYNSNGKMKLIKQYLPRNVEAIFDNLNMSLYKYIKEKKTNTHFDDDW